MPSSKNIQKYFAKAREASSKSDFIRQKLGAVMVYSGKVIAIGYNTMKTNPMQKLYNSERGYTKDCINNGACHAEMMLLLKTRYLDIDWQKVSVYVYREHGKLHTPMNAKPCAACTKALKERGISQIYFTTSTIPYSKL